MKSNKSVMNKDFDLFFLLYICAFAKKIEREGDKLLEEISFKQYLLLKIVSYCGSQPPSLGELAEMLDTPHQNVKDLINKLRSKGFVTISHDEASKKKQRIFLTDYGKEFLDNRRETDIELFNKAARGISHKQLQTVLDTVTQIDNNLAGTSVIRIKTWEGNEIEASSFKICKLFPRSKNKPKYQLYASNGDLIQVTGINRNIIGFYTNEESINREMEEINKAQLRKDSGYIVKYFTEVEFDFWGTVSIKKDDN